jgi:hypothetical protein
MPPKPPAPVGNRQIVVILFAMSAGAITLGTITAAALVIHLPLLFPPLAPSAFILIVTPLAAVASPRNVVLSHTPAVVVGMASLNTVDAMVPEAGLMVAGSMCAYRVLAIAMTVGAISAMMTLLRCSHPPAATATAGSR